MVIDLYIYDFSQIFQMVLGMIQLVSSMNAEPFFLSLSTILLKGKRKGRKILEVVEPVL